MTRQLICCLLVVSIANVLAFEDSRSPGSDMVKRPQNPYSWMNKYRVKKSHPLVEQADEVLDEGELEKRARNPYAWTVTDSRFVGKRGARNPYSWMNDSK
uniref:Neuropeptide n=1 Tax=Steinernema glaseri TaxID=37863 RepID=A0A1I7ZE29_9BILA